MTYGSINTSENDSVVASRYRYYHRLDPQSQSSLVSDSKALCRVSVYFLLHHFLQLTRDYFHRQNFIFITRNLSSYRIQYITFCLGCVINFLLNYFETELLVNSVNVLILTKF